MLSERASVCPTLTGSLSALLVTRESYHQLELWIRPLRSTWGFIEAKKFRNIWLLIH